METIIVMAMGNGKIRFLKKHRDGGYIETTEEVTDALRFTDEGYVEYTMKQILAKCEQFSYATNNVELYRCNTSALALYHEMKVLESVLKMCKEFVSINGTEHGILPDEIDWRRITIPIPEVILHHFYGTCETEETQQACTTRHIRAEFHVTLAKTGICDSSLGAMLDAITEMSLFTRTIEDRIE